MIFISVDMKIIFSETTFQLRLCDCALTTGLQVSVVSAPGYLGLCALGAAHGGVKSIFPLTNVFCFCVVTFEFFLMVKQKFNLSQR